MEKRVTTLERLPARVDALTLQVSQLRTEMREEFSAIREEVTQTRDELSTEMRDLHADTRDKIDAQGVQMRVLHEDVIGRIALLSEGLTERGPKRRRKR